MSEQWKLSRHDRGATGKEMQYFKGPEWVYPNLEMGQTAAVRDAQEIHGEVGPMNWVNHKSDPVTFMWEIDQDHWYTLTQLAEELEG